MANPFRLPLNALRAIEIVARTGHLGAAAEELGVTPGAVSQHLKRAEERLGFVLFERSPQGMRPTDALAAALPHLSTGFNALIDALAVLDNARRCLLTISVAPAFAARWLVPRLGRFTRDNPDVEIRFVASAQLVDLNHSDIDCAIRLGRGNWPGVELERLLPQPFFPVATPDWLPRLAKPADLARVPVIHDEGTMVRWEDWFEAVGEPVQDLAGPRFSDPILALEAVLAGQGVMLGWEMVVADALASGRLVRPFEGKVCSDLAYWFVTSERTARKRQVRIFADWLKRELALQG